MSAWSPPLLSILRLVSALLFLEHGASKVLGFPPPPMHAAGPPMPAVMAFLAQASGPIELIGGLFLVLGLFTRVTAFILSGEMAVAYFLVHAPRGFFPILNAGELAIVYCFAFLYLAAAGPGPWSVDAIREK